MVFSVGNSIRTILKNGADKSYFLLGDDYFMQKIFIDKIKDLFSESSNIEYFYFNEQLDIDLFFNNINSMSLFGDKKIFVIKNFSRLSSFYQRNLEQYLNQSNNDNTLIFVLNDFVIKNKFSRKISEKCTVVDTRTPINRMKIKEWVRYYYKKEGISINDNSLEYLIENYSDDIMNILNEIEKNYLFYQTKDINIDFVNSEYESKHIKIWNLLDVLGKKKIKESINFYNNLYNNGNSLVPILINLYNFYFQLFNLNKIKSGYNPLNKILQSRMLSYKNNYSKNEISNILLNLSDIDIRIKTSTINENFLFLSTIIKICNGSFNEK